ncbi:MAG: cyanophycinase [Bacteroidota bacterium]|nr:cyanophycinase [Candidatus Kapabacteria bacterium]MDW8219526.1 cyanophycinase [Bacteroidota bacterium]
MTPFTYILRTAIACLCTLLYSCQQSAQTDTSSQPSSQNQTSSSSSRPVWLGLVGDTADIQASTQSGTVLMGGSTDVDEAMRWMLERAGGGDVVVIRASGSTGYNNYLFTLGAKVNSVETLLINSRELANNPEIERRMRNAEMLFIAGGDQANYVNFWRNTRVHEALNYLANIKKIPIGGTSAGCAILGRLYFSALEGTIRSEEALANPFDRRITIGYNDFLAIPFLSHTITDTHYDNPDRLGRHTTFIARIIRDSTPSSFIRGIGVEERTAVAINAEGKATVFGAGRAYFLWQNGTDSTPEECMPNRPLTWHRNNQALRAYVIAGSTQGNGTFDLTNWSGGQHSGGRLGFVSVRNGMVFQQ